MSKLAALNTVNSTGANRLNIFSGFSVTSFDGLSHESFLHEDNFNYRVIFLKEGNYQWRSKDQTFTLAPLEIGLIKPRQPVSILSRRSGRGYLFSFSFEFMQAALSSAGMARDFHQNSLAGNIAVPEEDKVFLINIVEKLRQEYQTTKGLKDQILQGLFQIFLLYLNRIACKPVLADSGRCPYHINRFFSLLDEHFANLKMPADYAGMMAVSPSYLNFIIKENYGFNTSHFIQQRVFAEAKKLMLSPGMTMKEVAFQLGFVDVSHFSKFFKRNAGESFSEFRRNRAA